MKTSKKIKNWARVGQVAFWLYIIFGAIYEMQLPTYEPTASSGVEILLALIIITLHVLFSETIVRIIGYFAELLDK